MEEQIQDASNVTPLALVALLVMAYLIWTLPRRYAVCPLLVMTCLLPLGQQLVLFGLHLHLFRLLLLVGALRVYLRGEAAHLKWTRMDTLLIWWAIVTMVFGTMAKPSTELFINRSGDAFNAVGCYFFVRCVIVDFQDIAISVRTLAIVCLPFAALMLVEKTTAHNLLSVFGGVPAVTQVRDGHLRCQGAFRHPILAGTFGATQLPLFAGLWIYRPRYRRLASVAMVCAAIIVVTSSSSGSLLAFIAAIGGLALWKFRRHLRVIRWGAIALILCMAMMMKAPIWYVMAKLSDFVGGGGWHRAYLLDQAFSHINEWWLFGTTYTAHWGPAGEVIEADPNMMDITNHFVMEGIKGGALKLGLFMAMITVSFNGVGRAVRALSRKFPSGFFIWTFGVSLFAHCISMVSITYFDQIIIVWFWLLAVMPCIFRIPSASPAFSSLIEPRNRRAIVS